MGGALEINQAAPARVGDETRRAVHDIVRLYGSEWREQPMVLLTLHIVQVELAKLPHFEQSAICGFRNALNKCRHPTCALQEWYNCLRVWTRLHWPIPGRIRNRVNYYDSRVDTTDSYDIVNRADATGPKVTRLISTAMNACLTIAWHSAYPWLTTQSERQWGDSMVVPAGHSWESFLWGIATGTDPQQTMTCRTEAAGLPNAN